MAGEKAVESFPSNYWYDNREELSAGQNFRLHDGDIIQLDRRVPGDGTKWYALNWTGSGWSNEDFTIEPGDLAEKLDGQP